MPKCYKITESILFFLLIAASCQLFAAQPRTALVIGNANYRDAPLVNPVNDAKAVAASLKSLGFDVILKLDADQRTIDDAINDFGRKLEKGSVGLFYYAGHGIQSQGRNYLVPVSSDLEREKDLKYNAVDVGKVLDEMAYANNGLNIVILDACRNNPLTRSFRGAARGLVRMNDVPSGTVLAYSTAPGQVAADGNEQNSPYAANFIKAIQQKGVPLELVFKEVAKGVKKETQGQQVPWMSSSLSGDFYFNEGSAIESAAPAVIAPSYSKSNAAFLYVDTDPGYAEVKITNIAPAFKQGIALQPERDYSIKVTANGYEPYQKWYKLGAGEQRIQVALIASASNAGALPSNSIFQDTLSIGGKGPTMIQLTSDNAGVNRPFALGQTEVTFAEYDRFANATGRRVPDDEGWGRGNLPVINITREDALAYVDWLSKTTGKTYRLPTTAELNLLRKLDEECKRCETSVTEDKATHDVRSSASNKLGFYGIRDNAWEWGSDCAPAATTCDRLTLSEGMSIVIRGRIKSVSPIIRAPSTKIEPVGLRVARDF